MRPAARMTRRRTEEMYKLLHEEIKRKRRIESDQPQGTFSKVTKLNSGTAQNIFKFVGEKCEDEDNWDEKDVIFVSDDVDDDNRCSVKIEEPEVEVGLRTDDKRHTEVVSSDEEMSKEDRHTEIVSSDDETFDEDHTEDLSSDDETFDEDWHTEVVSSEEETSVSSPISVEESTDTDFSIPARSGARKEGKCGVFRATDCNVERKPLKGRSIKRRKVENPDPVIHILRTEEDENWDYRCTTRKSTTCSGKRRKVENSDPVINIIKAGEDENWDYSSTKRKGITCSGKRRKVEDPDPVVHIIRDEEDENWDYRRTKRKGTTRYGKRKLRDREIELMLSRSIVNDAEEPMPSEEGERHTASTVELKFTFGEDESPPKKSVLDEDLEELWREMALALDYSDAKEGEMPADESGTPDKLNVASRCRLGKHDLVLDEEIGLVCKNCLYCGLEIKYCMPPMMNNPWGKMRKEANQCGPNFSNDVRYENMEMESETCGNPKVNLSGSVWSMIPDLRSKMHPHQLEAFEFIWRKIAGGIDLNDLKSEKLTSRGSGCIISHAPGTGKTLLAVAFLSSYVNLYPFSRPVIVAPCFMLKNWEREIKKWKIGLNLLNLNSKKLDGNESEKALKLLSGGNPSVDTIRLIKLYSWMKGSSVLSVSYKLFDELTRDMKRKSSPEYSERKMAWKKLLQLPGLIILDEGHTPRNNRSRIWKALSSTFTGKKIILSGTPFQNNFDELLNLLCLVRPEFAQKSNLRGDWLSLTGKISRSSDDNLQNTTIEKVREMLDPFVHVHKGNILKENLPGFRDSLVVLIPSEIQRTLLEKVDKYLKSQTLHYECAMTVGSIHPYLLDSKFSNPECIDVDHAELERLELDPDCGVKTKFLMELIRLSNLMNEKVLVFSQYIDPLKLISKHLHARLGWVEGEEILFMHGGCFPDKRQSFLQKFNDSNTSSKVMLASTRACSEGICLTGASRVVLLDICWNPSVQKQAISRAYRLGQEKVVHVYYLLASGTLEEDKFRRQANKDRLSELVFYSSDVSECKGKMPPSLPDDQADKLLQKMVDSDKLNGCFKKIIYQPRLDMHLDEMIQ